MIWQQRNRQHRNTATPQPQQRNRQQRNRNSATVQQCNSATAQQRNSATAQQQSGAALGEQQVGQCRVVTVVSLAVSPLPGRLEVASGSDDATVRRL